jgi:hypothetical protein
MHAKVKQLNPHANTPESVKMNEIDPNMKIHEQYTDY